MGDNALFVRQAQQGGLAAQNGWALELRTFLDVLNHLLRNHSLNADGCGVGWFGLTSGTGQQKRLPCVYTTQNPSWSDHNLMNLCREIETRVAFAHVRAAGVDGNVSQTNSHPFRFGHFLWAHNGGIAHFASIKQYLIHGLPNSVFQLIRGSTDTEVAGAMFLTALPCHRGCIAHRDPHLDDDYTLEDIIQALETTIGKILTALDDWSEGRWEHGMDCLTSSSHRLTRSNSTNACSLNFVVSNGLYTVATRFRNSRWQEPPLLWATMTSHDCEKDEDGSTVCKLHDDQQQPSQIIISSEPPSKARAADPRTQLLLIPKNNLVYIDHNSMDLKIRPVAIPSFYVRRRMRQLADNARKRLAPVAFRSSLQTLDFYLGESVPLDQPQQQQKAMDYAVLALNDDTFGRAVSSTEREDSILVLFHAQWCADCQAMMKEWKLLSEHPSRRFHMFSLDIDHAPNLVSKFGISRVPTLLVIRAKTVAEYLGPRTCDAILNLILR